MPRNLILEQPNAEEGLSNDDKRMKLLESKVLSNFDSTRINNLGCEEMSNRINTNNKTTLLFNANSSSSSQLEVEEVKESLQLSHSKSQDEYSFESEMSSASPMNKKIKLTGENAYNLKNLFVG